MKPEVAEEKCSRHAREGEYEHARVQNWSLQLPSPSRSLLTKLRTTLDKFGEFWAKIAYFWLAGVGRNYLVSKKFSQLSKEISDPNDVSLP